MELRGAGGERHQRPQLRGQRYGGHQQRQPPAGRLQRAGVPRRARAAAEHAALEGCQGRGPGGGDEHAEQVDVAEEGGRGH